MTCTARTASRHGDARFVKGKQHFYGFSFLASKTDTDVAWKTKVAVSNQIDIGKNRLKALNEPISQSDQPCRFFGHRFLSNTGGFAKTDYPGHILGRRTKSVFLATAMDKWR